jgi:hypothetical protein
MTEDEHRERIKHGAELLANKLNEARKDGFMFNFAISTAAPDGEFRLTALTVQPIPRSVL